LANPIDLSLKSRLLKEFFSLLFSRL